MNKCIFSGNAVADAKATLTASGANISQFTIAINEGTKEKPKTTFIKVKAFDKLSSICNQYVKKGGKYLVEGRWSQTNYEKDGKNYTWEECVISNIEFMSKAPDKPIEDNATYGGTNYNGPTKQLPKSAPAQQEMPIYTADDIPF